MKEAQDEVSQWGHRRRNLNIPEALEHSLYYVTNLSVIRESSNNFNKSASLVLGNTKVFWYHRRLQVVDS